MKIDLFCHVVDNFGDAGVSARLARQLANDEGGDVRLWIDDLACLARLWPGIASGASVQRRFGVEIRRWDFDANPTPEADVVIEAFGGGLPAGFAEAMARRSRPPLWINLEYLTAEAFAASCHALPSPQPRLPLTRYFFFPGFAVGTGGLLRERDLAERRQAFQSDACAVDGFLEGIGVVAPDAARLRVSMFCYDNPALRTLVVNWRGGEIPIHCLVPQGSRDGVLEALGLGGCSVGEVVRQGSLTAQLIPFLDQDDYDRLLWSCDLNFVRGEDSFVRAQWAGRPFVWQPYVQKAEAHLEKLQAFVDRYLAGVDPDSAQATRRMFEAWNGRGDTALAWPAFAGSLSELARHAGEWENRLIALGSLAANLASFCKNALKSPV